MELSLAEAKRAIALRFKTEWALLYTANEVPFCIENEHFVEPPMVQPSGDAQYWIRLSFRPSDGGQLTLGSPGTRIFRRFGMIWVQIFGPVNVGTEGIDLIAGQVLGIFEGVAFSGIDPNGNANPQSIGDDGRWYEVAVTIPVTYYELK